MGGKWNDQKYKKMNMRSSETVKKDDMIHETSVSY